MSIFLIASVSAADLNTTDEIVSDSVEDVVAIENSDGLISVEDAGNFTVVESDFEDELSVNNDSEVLGKTYTLNNGGDLGSTINSASSGDTIILNSGTYNIWDFGIGKSITIVGQNNPVLSSKGHGDKSMFLTGSYVTFKNVNFQSESAKWGNVFYIYSGLLTVDNCTFSGGFASKGGGSIRCCDGGTCRILNSRFVGTASDGDGGAIRVETTGEIINCTFDGCRGTYGGAIQSEGSNNLRIINSTFKNCNSRYGGGVRIGGNTKQLLIDGCKFINNVASEDGGAISRYESSEVNIINSYFEGNSAKWGGAVFLKYTDGTISNCTFKNNHAYVDSGAISGGALSDCIFINNIADDFGGAASWGSYYNCKFIGNYAKNYGGAIQVGSANIWNCEFINNSVSVSGGAIKLQSGSSNVKNCTFISNSAKNSGGAVYADAKCKMDTCNFERNTASSQPSCFGGSSSNYAVNDCIFDVAPQGITNYITSILSVDDFNIVNGEDAIISVKLYNILGPLSDKEIIFTINDKSYPKNTFFDGIATFNATNYIGGLGNQKVVVRYDGDSINTMVSKTINIKVNMYRANLMVIQSGKYYGDKSLSFKLVDFNGNPINNAQIHLIFYSNGNTIKTDDIFTKNGMVSYSMSAFEPGSYSLCAYVSDDNVDVNSVELNNILISKISGSIELDTSNNNKTLNIKLVNKTTGDVFSGIPVKLEFSNGYETIVTTDSNGCYSYPMLFDLGIYTVSASVDSNGYKEFPKVELRNIVISTTGKDDSVIEFNDEIVFDYLKSGYATVKRMEGCTGIEAEVINHPEAKVVVGNDNNITVSRLDAGNYTLSVTSIPDIYHNAVTRTVAITVNRIDSTLSITPLTCNYGDSITMTANVVGGGISYRDVTVEGLQPIINVINNMITVSGLPAGTHTLKVSTTPDDNHLSVTKTTTITVRKVNSVIDFESPMVFVYGTVGSISLTLEGCGIVKEGCSIDGHNEAIIDVNENVVMVSNLSAGHYTLKISSSPDSNHNGVTQDIVVTVTEADSDVDLNTKPLVFDYGGVGQSDLILDGCIVLSDDVSIVGHGEAITRVNNNVVYVSNLAAGNYTLQIKTTPDGNHKSVTKTFDVTVNKPLSTVEFIGSADFDYLGVGKTTLKLVGGTVNLDDIEVVDYPDAGISLGKGNIISIYDLDSGNYTLKVKTTPDNNHRANVATLAFTVNKINSKINFTNALVFDYLKSDFTYITVEGADLSKTMIYVDGHPGASVDLEGNKITVSGLNPGTYTLCAITSPDDNHYAAEMNLSITVNKVYALISAPKASVYYNSGNAWSVKLYDGNTKEVLSNMQVSVKVYTGSKLYKSFTLTTNAKGIASVKVSTWTVGAHKVVLSFSKDGYKSASANSVVTILKTPVVITAPKLSVYLKTAKKWSIKVVDSKTKKALASTKLTLKVYTGKKYKSYSVKTNSKGIATFATSGLSVGTHKVLVSFSKTGYVSKSVSSSIVVKPIPLTIKGDFSYGASGSTVRVTVTNKLTGKPANGISVKLMVYTGSKITKSYTLVTANYKNYKGFVGFGTNAFSVGTHKVIIKPVSNMYSGQGTTSLVIKSGAANGGVYYSFVSKGKLTLA